MSLAYAKEFLIEADVAEAEVQELEEFRRQSTVLVRPYGLRRMMMRKSVAPFCNS
jgi:hypothetical protein